MLKQRLIRNKIAKKFRLLISNLFSGKFSNVTCLNLKTVKVFMRFLDFEWEGNFLLSFDKPNKNPE